jgi:hypothetical protein
MVENKVSFDIGILFSYVSGGTIPIDYRAFHPIAGVYGGAIRHRIFSEAAWPFPRYVSPPKPRQKPFSLFGMGSLE